VSLNAKGKQSLYHLLTLVLPGGGVVGLLFGSGNEKPRSPFDDRGSPYGTRLFVLLLGKAEEVHHLIIVIESNDEESIILVMVDLISHTDTTASEEGDGVVEVVATEGRVVGDVQRLLASDEADGVVLLATLDVVGDVDPDLVEGIETDVDAILHASV
jgi:hypothetical protein